MSAPSIGLRQVFRAFLLRQLADETKSAFARRTGIAQPDVVNAANGKRPLSLLSVERMASALNRPLSSFLMELAGIAMEMESLVASDSAVARPELRAAMRPVSGSAGAAAPLPTAATSAPTAPLGSLPPR